MAMDILFRSDMGLLSLFTIAFILGMGGFIGWYVRKHVREEERQLKH